MTFKYFDKPEFFGCFKDIKTTCDTCGQDKICFDAELFYGSDELNSICSECLSSGKLNDKNSFTCEGDIEELKRQLRTINPSLTNLEIDEIANQKTLELEKTTPYLVTWQNWSWPCVDGDYCKFIGFGSKSFYKNLAKDTNVEDFFRESFYEKNTNFDYLWKEALPDKEIKNYNDSTQYETLFYVFRSINSEKVVTIWDCL
jgi:uncharacterized protein CbrC (UPF0167 family)